MGFSLHMGGTLNIIEGTEMVEKRIKLGICCKWQEKTIGFETFSNSLFFYFCFEVVSNTLNFYYIDHIVTSKQRRGRMHTVKPFFL